MTLGYCSAAPSNRNAWRSRMALRTRHAAQEGGASVRGGAIPSANYLFTFSPFLSLLGKEFDE